MLKTYLYIPEELNLRITSTAKTQAKSKAEVMRQAMEKGISDLGTFDIAVACGILHHLNNPVKTIRELSTMTNRLFLCNDCAFFYPFLKWNISKNNI